METVNTALCKRTQYQSFAQRMMILLSMCAAAANSLEYYALEGECQKRLRFWLTEWLQELKAHPELLAGVRHLNARSQS